MLQETFRGLCFHHADASDPHSEWHNALHGSLDETITRLKQSLPTPEIKRHRVIASETIGNLKVSARLLDPEDNVHWLEAVTSLNAVLPEDQKIYIPPSTPQV